MAVQGASGARGPLDGGVAGCPRVAVYLRSIR
jgi:hypothetical protein